MRIHFFNDLAKSIYGPAFYTEARSGSLKKAFGYFFKLALLAALLLTVILGVRIGPALSRILSPDGITQVVNVFPADLQIMVKKGQVSSNMKEPYAVPFPPDLKTAYRNSSALPENIFVLDTGAPATVDSFDRSKTLILLTKEYMITQKNNGRELSIQRLSSFPDMTLDRQSIAGWLAQVQPFFKFVIPFLLVSAFAVLFISNSIGYLLIVLILSFIAWLVFKLRKSVFRYAELYKLGLYATTLAIAADVIFSLIGLHLSWYIDCILILLAIFVNIRSVPTPAPAPTVQS